MADSNVELLKELDEMLQYRRGEIRLYNDYYRGHHRLTFATSKFKEAFGNLFAAFADNWMKVIVDTPVERLQVEGFRTEDATNDDLWRIWTGNNMDVASHIAHTEAVKTGIAYVLVDPMQDPAKIVVKDGKTAITVTDPATGERYAGAHFWLNDNMTVGAELLLPGGAIRYHTKDPILPEIQGSVENRIWIAEGSVEYDLQEIPLIPIANSPDTRGRGVSELKSVIPMQDAINKLATDMIVASEYQAFRQRVLTGVEIPRDENGNPIQDEQMKAAFSRLWVFEPEGAKVTELAASDLSNYVNAIEALLQHLAAQTRTPPHYLLGSIVNVSGDALAAAESGLVSKVSGMQRTFTQPWREAMQIASGIDDPIDIVWKNPERQSLSVVADAAVKLNSIGVPMEETLRVLGYSPIEIEKLMKKIEANKPPAPPPTPQIPPPNPPGNIPPQSPNQNTT